MHYPVRLSHGPSRQEQDGRRWGANPAVPKEPGVLAEGLKEQAGKAIGGAGGSQLSSAFRNHRKNEDSADATLSEDSTHNGNRAELPTHSCERLTSPKEETKGGGHWFGDQILFVSFPLLPSQPLLF